MAFERLTSRFRLENGLAHLAGSNIVKINLAFNASRNFFGVAPSILSRYGKSNKWHGHLIKGLKVGFSVNRAYYILKFSNITELADWLADVKTKYADETSIRDKFDFLKYSVDIFGTPSGPRWSNTQDDIPDNLTDIKFMFDVNAREEYDQKKYQQFIFDDIEEDYDEYPRKSYVNIEDISDDEEREAAHAFEDNSRRAINRQQKQDLELKRNIEQVERESANFAEEFNNYGEGIIRLNDACRKSTAKRFGL
jgi:hypothetical protein